MGNIGKFIIDEDGVLSKIIGVQGAYINDENITCYRTEYIDGNIGLIPFSRILDGRAEIKTAEEIRLKKKKMK